jgi:hypothetical protein
LLGGDPASAEAKNLLTENTDGTFTLKSNFQTKNYQRLKNVYVLKKPQEFIQKGGGSLTRKAGTIMDSRLAQDMIKKGMGDKLYKIPEAIRLTPETYSFRENLESGAVEAKQPKIGTFDIIIPIEQATELRAVPTRKNPIAESSTTRDLGL